MALANDGQGKPGHPPSSQKRRGRPKPAALFPRLLAEHLFGAQLLDVALAEAEPACEHVLGVLAELWRGLQFGWLAVEADRPGLAYPLAVGVVHRLHDAAVLEAL